MKKILFIGVGWVAAKYLREAVLALGYEPVLLLNINNYAPDIQDAINKSEYYQLERNTASDIEEIFVAHPKLREQSYAITTFFDELFPVVNTIAEKYHLCAPEKILAQLADKAYVQSLIPDYCPASLLFSPHDIPVSAIQTLLSGQPQNFILKPSLSAGALGIVELAQQAITRENLQNLIRTSTLDDAMTQSWMIQQKITGDLFSLEGFVQNGETSMVGFSKRSRVGSTESANLFPADHILPHALQQRCYTALNNLVALSGFKNGYFHCEYLVTPHNAYLIDANMGRFAGASIIEQVALSYQLKVSDILRHLLQLSLQIETQQAVPAYDLKQRRDTLSIYYGMVKPACFERLQITAPLTSVHTQYAVAQKQMPAFGNTDYAWVGALSGYADDVLADIHHIRIQTTAEILSPVWN